MSKSNKLQGRKVALLVAEGFEESELLEPKRALEEESADVEIVSLKKDRVRSWSRTAWGSEFPVDAHIAEARVDGYAALVLPGGVMSPDHLRMDERAVRFAKAFVESGKPVAAICHGPWLLVEAGVLRSRRVTSYPSLRTDLTNAGAEWVDEPVVVDGNLITSRRPDDLPAFCTALIHAIGRPMGAHAPAELRSATSRL